MNQTNSTPVASINLPDPVDTSLELIRIRSFQNIANGSLLVATILFFFNLYIAIQARSILNGAIAVILFGIIFVTTFLRSLSFRLRTVLLAFAFFATGIIGTLSQGLNANGLLYFFSCIVILAVLLEKNEWLIGLVLSSLAISVIVLLRLNGIIQPQAPIFQENSVLLWLSTAIILIFLSYLVASTIYRNIHGLSALIGRVQVENTQITQKEMLLTDQVSNLEIELDRRRSRLIAARQIAREVSQGSDLNELLKQSVELIRSQFGYYHAGIFLKDAKSEFAVLKAATGEAGKAMLARRHQLKIREEGIVGYVVARGEVRIASDVEADITHAKNPFLPSTKAEMAVPLRAGDAIIGALDIQSEKTNAFTAEDVEVIQTIADQLAVAIDAAQQIQQLKQSISELQEGYRAFTSGAWQRHLQGSRKKLNFVYNNNDVLEAVDRVPLFNEAIKAGKPVITPIAANNDLSEQGVMVSVPIKLRDQVLGVVNLKYDGKNMPEDLVNLINTASDRLGIALENARLLEEIQERAEREHTVGDIAAKVRASSDIDSILRTAVAELGKTLGVDETRIQLKTTASEN